MASGGGNKNSSSSDSRYSNSSMPVIPDQWKAQNTNLINVLGSTGVTNDQQANIDALKDISAGQNAYTQAGYYSLQDLSKKFGGEWATPTAVSTQSFNPLPINALPINAQAGASFMGAYKNPWDQDVIDASIADYNANADRSLNAMRAGRDASGAFGDRAAIADAVFNADAARGVGSLVSGLRQGGFNTAAALGQQDANRALTADQTNAANKLTADQTNAANKLAADQAYAANKLTADTFNNNLTNNRQQFSVNQAMQGDQNRMQAFRDIQNNLLAQSGIQQGGIANLMQLLGTGTSTFGNQSDGTSHTDQRGKTSSGKSGGISPGTFLSILGP